MSEVKLAFRKLRLRPVRSLVGLFLTVLLLAVAAAAVPAVQAVRADPTDALRAD